MARIILGLVLLVILLAAGSATWLPRIVTAPVYHCSHLLLERKTADEIQTPDRTVGSHDYLYVADECSKLQKKWVGENVTACDSVGSFAPTIIPFGAGSFSPWISFVHRKTLTLVMS